MNFGAHSALLLDQIDCWNPNRSGGYGFERVNAGCQPGRDPEYPLRGDFRTTRKAMASRFSTGSRAVTDFSPLFRLRSRAAWGGQTGSLPSVRIALGRLSWPTWPGRRGAFCRVVPAPSFSGQLRVRPSGLAQRQRDFCGPSRLLYHELMRPICTALCNYMKTGRI